MDVPSWVRTQTYGCALVCQSNVLDMFDTCEWIECIDYIIITVDIQLIALYLYCFVVVRI